MRWGSLCFPAKGRGRTFFLWILFAVLLVIMLIVGLTVGLVLGLAHHSHAANIDLTVDLGYSKYEGTNAKNGVSQWWGIRYAANPIGDNRFRAPQDPPVVTDLQKADKVSRAILPLL